MLGGLNWFVNGSTHIRWFVFQIYLLSSFWAALGLLKIGSDMSFKNWAFEMILIHFLFIICSSIQIYLIKNGFQPIRLFLVGIGVCATLIFLLRSLLPTLSE